jgi:hypothetical protein
VHLPTHMIQQMRLVRCPSCWHVYLEGARHPPNCIPVESNEALSTRGSLHQAIESGSLFSVNFGNVPMAASATWDEIFTRPVSTHESLPANQALQAAITEVFMLVSAAMLNKRMSLDERENACKLFFMLPFLLFQQSHSKPGTSISRQLHHRTRLFLASQFDELLASANATQRAYAQFLESKSRTSQPSLPKLKRITNLACNGNIGKATDLLLSSASVQDLNDQDVRRKVLDLFPARHIPTTQQPLLQSTLQQTPPPHQALGTTVVTTTCPDADMSVIVNEQVSNTVDDGQAPSQLSITAQDVTSALAKCQKAAAGPTGWHITFIKTIGRTAAGRTRIAELLGYFLSTECPTGLADAFHFANLTVLSKSNNGVRPIITRNTWLRLLSKTIVIKEQRIHSTNLAPLQAGVGMPGGSEFIIHSVRHLLHTNPSWIAVAIDCANAYGTLRRDNIRASLPANSLCSEYFLKYCNDKIIAKSANISIPMSEGVAQGDPLSPLFFARTLQPVLRDVQAAMAQQCNNARIFAYLDDIVLVGPPSAMPMAFETYKTKCADIGLKINERKTKVLMLPSTDEASNQLTHEFISNNLLPDPVPVIDLLGSPVGHPVEEAKMALELSKTTASSRLREMNDNQVKLLLLRSCLARTSTYLLRATPPDATAQAATYADASTHGDIADILGITPLHMSTRLEASLPLRLGGLDIPILSTTRHIAYFASITATIQSWRNYIDDNNELLTTWCQSANESYTATQLKASLQVARKIAQDEINRRSNTQAVSALTINIPEYTTDIVNFADTKNLQHKLSTTQSSLVQDYIFNTGLRTVYEKAQFRSKTGYASAAFIQAIPSDRSLKMSNKDFQISLRMYLRLPILPMFNIQGNIACYCNKLDKTTHSRTMCDEIHVLNCAGDNARSIRHHELVAAMQLMYQSVELTAVLEPLATTSTVSRARHDLSVLTNQTPYSSIKIDVTVRNPLNHAMVAQAAKHNMHAAITACRDKIDKYKPYLQRGEAFVPVAFESFGAFHQNIVEQIALAGQRANHAPPDTSTWASPTFEAYWTQRLSVTLWRANSKLVSTIIERTKAQHGYSDQPMLEPSSNEES